MLADPRAQEMIDDFHTRWLAAGRSCAILNKDEAKFPEFEALKPLMHEEIRRFAGYVMGEGDGKLRDAADRALHLRQRRRWPSSTASRPPAMPGRRSNLDPTQRAGMLTQSAFLATHGREGSVADLPRHRHPRAAAVRGAAAAAARAPTLCCRRPARPRPPAIGWSSTGGNPECASCHNLMDTLGYGFESFDDMGRYRTTENNINIDDSGELVGTDIDGAFKGPIELAQRLASSPRCRSA